MLQHLIVDGPVVTTCPYCDNLLIGQDVEGMHPRCSELYREELDAFYADQLDVEAALDELIEDHRREAWMRDVLDVLEQAESVF